jgi:hypothetical protein
MSNRISFLAASTLLSGALLSATLACNAPGLADNSRNLESDVNFAVEHADEQATSVALTRAVQWAGTPMTATSTRPATYTPTPGASPTPTLTLTPTDTSTPEPTPTYLQIGGYWHSAVECGEADAPYSWEIELRQTGDVQVDGEIRFHNCPGGGRAVYAVSGTIERGYNYVVLEGRRTSSRGTLANLTPDVVSFEARLGLPPNPNFLP